MVVERLQHEVDLAGRAAIGRTIDGDEMGAAVGDGPMDDSGQGEQGRAGRGD